jgi:sugar phosphate isomerase/epimerase
MKYAAFTVQMPEYELEQVYQKLKAFGFDGVEMLINTDSRIYTIVRNVGYFDVK